MNSLEFHKNKNTATLPTQKNKALVDFYHILPIVKRNPDNNLDKYDKHQPSYFIVDSRVSAKKPISLHLSV
jgi:hypothetical protein